MPVLIFPCVFCSLVVNKIQMQAIRKQKDAVRSKQTYSKKPRPVWNETGKTAFGCTRTRSVIWGKAEDKSCLSWRMKPWENMEWAPGNWEQENRNQFGQISTSNKTHDRKFD